ncbi:MAG: VWA domain-containing protein [Pelagibacterium sp.]|uniref:VWA domain-containing protein n=1 Tax=Pelagibacterium sp. TaxID=1967288 RepID=UPI0032EC970F
MMIGFAAPLFASLLLAAGFVWFLHSRREYRHVVPSLALWRQLQTHAGLKPKARLIPPITIPLLLQLLAVGLFALALTQPFWGNRSVPDHLIVVIDTGASMRNSTDGETAFEAARSAVLAGFSGDLQPTPARVSLIAAGPRPGYIAARWAWTGDALGRALEDVSMTDGTSDWSVTARLIPGIARSDETTKVLFVSDRPAPAFFVDAIGDMALSQHIVAASGDNAGISATLRLTDPAANMWTLSGEVLLGGERETLAISVQYAADSSRTPLDWTTIDLDRSDAQTGTVAFSEELELPGPGIVTAFIPADANPRDNRLRFIAEPADETLDILYVGDGELPLLRALNAVSGVRIFQDSTVPESVDGFGLVIVETRETLTVPATNSIIIETGGAPLADADPDDWSSNHALSRDMDWASLAIETGTGLTPNEGETTLLSADGVALMTAMATGTGRHVRIGFDPRRSNWPETSSMPIFVANLIDWIGREPGAPPAASCTVGVPCRIDARLLGQPIINLEMPGRPSARVPEGDFIPREVGLFRAGQGALTHLLAINPAVPGIGSADFEGTDAIGWPQGWALWLLAAGFVVLAVEGVLTAKKQGWLPRLSALRLVTLALLVAGIANFAWPWPGSKASVVVVTAQPDSPQAATSADAGGIVAGPSAYVVADLDMSGPATSNALRVTHTSQALELAAAMIPPERDGYLVLAGDTAPEPQLGRELAARGIVVDYLETPRLDDGEVFVGRLDVPQQVLSGEAVPLTALVHSADVQTVSMEIVSNGQAIASQDVALNAGQNRIQAILPQIESGENLVEIRLGATDPYPQNDAIGQMLSTAPVRPVAIVSADPAHGEAFRRLLDDQGLEAVVFEPRRAPYYIKDWLGFGDIVLLNTPALSLTTLQQTLIETAVEEYGMGLLILGGPNSFGPGGYFGTPLEAVSPLSSRVPQDAPEVVMVFVLDRSGSMQQPVGEGNRLDVAKSATMAATELLNPQSRVGIIAFDAEARALLPLTRLADAQGAVQASLEGFDPGGGTAIYPGLVEAFDMLQGVEAAAKHIVVMTDGLSQPGDFPGIVGQLRAEGVTVSAVAIGQGADTTVARTIADLGGGAAHVTADFEALPSILSQEAMLLASPVKEGATRPVWQDRSANFLQALPAQLPQLSGFVGTTAKPDAELVATTTDDEGRDMPVLAYWRYGNGMVMALTTDATGPWSDAWQRLPQYGALWNDILLQFQPTTPRPGLTLTTASDGDYLDLRVSALDEDGLPLTGRSLVATISPPQDLVPETTGLTEVRPGLYEGRRVLDAIGRYGLSIDQGGDVDPIEAAYYHSYDTRYDFSRVGGAQALARATGGTAITPQEISTLGAGLTLTWLHSWPAWALLAFAAFLIDLSLRYRRFSSRRKPGTTDDQPQTSRQGAPIL